MWAVENEQQEMSLYAATPPCLCPSGTLSYHALPLDIEALVANGSRGKQSCSIAALKRLRNLSHDEHKINYRLAMLSVMKTN